MTRCQPQPGKREKEVIAIDEPVKVLWLNPP